MKKKNTVVILCGGKGTRLGSIGKKTPKTLVKINDKPILWYILNALKKNSFNHFILPTGYKGTMIKNYIKKNHNLSKNCKIDIIPTGTSSLIAKRIFKIKKYIKSDNFVLLNGDAIFNFDLFKIFKRHIRKKIDTTFLVTEVQFSFGVIGVVNKKIVSFERDINFESVNIKKSKNFLGYVYSGMAILNKKVLNNKFEKFINFEKEFYPIIIKKYKTNFEEIKNFWRSIDSQKDISFLNNKKNKHEHDNIKKLKNIKI